MHVGEPGQRIEVHRYAVRVLERDADGAMIQVVAPRHVVPVQQPGDVRPGERRRPVGQPLGRHVSAVTAHRVAGAGALGRPAGHLVQVGRQAPRSGRLEHAVLEHEVLRVCPVVRYVAPNVVAHYIGAAWRGAGLAHHLLGLNDKAVHVPAVVVTLERRFAVRIVAVAVVMVHPRLRASGVARVGQADTGWNTVGTRVPPEVVIERPVFLRDHDDMLDLVDSGLVNMSHLLSRPRGYADGYDTHSDDCCDPGQPERSPDAARTARPGGLLTGRICRL